MAEFADVLVGLCVLVTSFFATVGALVAAWCGGAFAAPDPLNEPGWVRSSPADVVAEFSGPESPAAGPQLRVFPCTTSDV